MLKNGQTYFKNLAVFTSQDFKSMFGHFSKSFDACAKSNKKNYTSLINRGVNSNCSTVYIY